MRKQTIFLYVPLILFKIGDKMANKRRRTYICHFLAVQSFLPIVYRIVALVHVLRFVW